MADGEAPWDYGAVELAVNRETEAVGYTALLEAGLEDYAFEAIVVRHPELFSAEAVQHSQARVREWKKPALRGASMPDLMASEKQPALDEVHRRLGRNILLFQLIELRLKGLLPLIHREGARHCLDRFQERVDAASRQTLGRLLSKFDEVVRCDVDGFSGYLAQIAAQRNELIHHIHTNPSLNLTTIEGCRTAATYLDKQFEEIRQFNGLVQKLLVGIMELLRDVTFKDTPGRSIRHCASRHAKGWPSNRFRLSFGLMNDDASID
jgi:hypothetical protein